MNDGGEAGRSQCGRGVCQTVHGPERRRLPHHADDDGARKPRRWTKRCWGYDESRGYGGGYIWWGILGQKWRQGAQGWWQEVSLVMEMEPRAAFRMVMEKGQMEAQAG